MRIVITDSGLGGLSIAAKLYENIKLKKTVGDHAIIFANALLANNKGYNTFSKKSEKVRIFNRALTGFEAHLAPDVLAIACNTLSVLYEETAYSQTAELAVFDIVSGGMKLFQEQFQQSAEYNLIVLGTETTIESGQHARRLEEIGIPSTRIVPQACPHLASQIEKDPDSTITQQIVANSLIEAKSKLHRLDAPLILFLACTHYGYIRRQIEDTAISLGFRKVTVFNPNDSMVAAILAYIEVSKKSTESQNATSIQVITRTPFLDEEIDSVSALLRPVSPDTANALRNYVVRDEFF